MTVKSPEELIEEILSRPAILEAEKNFIMTYIRSQLELQQLAAKEIGALKRRVQEMMMFK